MLGRFRSASRRRSRRRTGRGRPSRAAFSILATLLAVFAASALATAGPARPIAPEDAGIRLNAGAEGISSPRLPEFAAFFLSDADVDHYRRIFALQAAGDMGAADEIIEEVADRRLMGHVLFQRYMHPTAWRSTYPQLRSWMAEYADHPRAQQVYRLAQQRRPSGSSRPRRPVTVDRQYGTVENYGVATCRYELGRTRYWRTERNIHRHLRNARITIAYNYLEGRRPHIHRTEFDRLRAEVAGGYFYAGLLDKAMEHATAVMNRSGGRAPQAYWIAGLASWRMQDYAVAAEYFEQFANAECSGPWSQSAGAYWAARAHLRARQPDAVDGWLQHAAQFPHTFYGQIAQRTLGIDLEYNFRSPALTIAHLDALAAFPAAHRALGLLQVGRRELARDELIRIRPADAPPLVQEALVALADQADMPQLGFAVGSNVTPAGGGYFDAALYPVPTWEPAEGFQADRALVYAIIRQESRFNPNARSRAGARGLMQMMPGTAIHVGGRGFRGSSGRARLYDPPTNLQLGQTYINRMLDHRHVNGDLARMLIAYNAGPGRLASWLRRVEYDDDALLFIESIPNIETRGYLERVMANLWIYRKRLGQPTPTLDRIASGGWPRYTSLDEGQIEVAERGED